MESISKKICKLLSLVLVISFILPTMFTVSEASSDIELVSIVIYEDSQKIVSVEVPKNLSNNKVFLEKIKNDYLNNISSYSNLTTSTLRSVATPFYVTPEQPPKPTRKLISVKRWGLSELKSRLAATKKGNEIIRKALGSDVADIAVSIMEVYGANGVASLTQSLLKGFYNFVGGRSEKWLSESLAMMLKGQIKYVEQRIYENLAGDYPKVFVETVRVK